MKRLAVFLLVLAVPMALFAQAQQGPEKKMLQQQLGLTDAQVTQVLDIQGKTRATMRADVVQLRLLKAQMDKALLPAPASVDMTAVNGFITQMGQTRTEMQKTMVAAKLQLRTIMGDDNFSTYMRFVHRALRPGGPMDRGMDGEGPRVGPREGTMFDGPPGGMMSQFD
jgi:hypothetical protein